MMAKVDVMNLGPGKVFHLFRSLEESTYPEIVGIGAGKTIGMVIPNIDPAVRENLRLQTECNSIAVLTGCIGAATHYFCADEASKLCNVEYAESYLARDTLGAAAHAGTIIMGAKDVSDARRAVELTLSFFDKYWRNQYFNDVGHLEIQYTANAGHILAKTLGAEVGKPWAMLCGSPFAVGMLMADYAVKTADVEVLDMGTPDHGSSHSNECTLYIKGEASAVEQAVKIGTEVGVNTLKLMGGPVHREGTDIWL